MNGTYRWIATCCAFVLVAWRALPAGGQPDGQPTSDPPAPDAGPPPDAAPPAATSPEPAPAPEPEPLPAAPAGYERNLAGSIQLDVMAVPSRDTGRDIALDGATAEVSIKITNDFSSTLSASVKACFACHGPEVGMALFDIRMADALNVRVGRFTPSFGEFPARHDPANHRTSDKPLIYDMGRMVRLADWNEGVLPAPWVDNGVEINGTRYVGEHFQADYAAYAIAGPRAGAEPTDFDFRLSRSGEAYYADNNSRPVLGGQLVASFLADRTTFALGVSTMRGTYDPDHRLAFAIAGAHAVLRVGDVFVRAEYLTRRTRMALGSDPGARFKYGPGPDGSFDPYFVKDGGTLELEVPLGDRFTAVLREDGLRRRGNVLATSDLRKDSAILRHTAAVAVLLHASLRLKLSYEYYDFSDFDDEHVIHAGVAGPF
jgi:hypothetical protein